MLKKMLVVLSSLVIAGLVASPAYAKPKPPKPPKKPKVFVNPGYVHKTIGLKPGHRYRIQVSSPKHVRFTASGFEDVSWIVKGQIGETTRPVQFKGTTPKSYTLSQPVKQTLESWILGITVQDNSNQPLTVRFVDLGKHA